MTRLEVNDFLGADRKMYRDLGVDSMARCVTLWLRRKLDDGSYHIVVSLIKGRVLSQQIDEEEAKALYFELPDKVEYAKAFDGKVPKLEELLATPLTEDV